MASFDNQDAPIPKLSSSVKTFFDDRYKPATFTDMEEWNRMRDFLWNFGVIYKSQVLASLPRPRQAVYKDRRIYAHHIAKALNLIQEDYADRLSVVGNQGRHICEAFCAIFAPTSDEFRSTIKSTISKARVQTS
jgi:hypothetical protein